MDVYLLIVNMILDENNDCNVPPPFFFSPLQTLVLPDKFQHILRVMNTNIDGRRKVMFALTAIKVMIMTCPFLALQKLILTLLHTF